SSGPPPIRYSGTPATAYERGPPARTGRAAARRAAPAQGRAEEARRPLDAARPRHRDRRGPLRGLAGPPADMGGRPGGARAGGDPGMPAGPAFPEVDWRDTAPGPPPRRARRPDPRPARAGARRRPRAPRGGARRCLCARARRPPGPARPLPGPEVALTAQRPD